MLDKRISTYIARYGIERVRHSEINWDYHNKIVHDAFGSEKILSEKLGRSKSYVNQCKRGIVDYTVADIEKLLKWVNVNQKALFTSLTEADDVVEEPAPANNDPFDVLELESDFEKTVRKTLDDITTKLEMLLELESKVNAINANIGELMERVPKVDYPTMAVDILKKTLENASMGGNACQYTTYMDALEAKRVPKSYARDAVNRIGATLQSTGYGKEKTMWVIREGERK